MTKLLLFILLPVLIFAMAFIGMLILHKKSKNGEIELHEKSWHFSLMKYLWGIETIEVTNICPYYWACIGSILILPAHLLFYTVLYKLIFCNLKKVYRKAFPYKEPVQNEELLEKEKEDEIKSELYRKLSKGSDYFITMLYMIAVLFGFIFLMYSFFSSVYNVFGIKAIVAVVSVIIYSIILIVQYKVWPEFNKHHIDHLQNLGNALYGILKGFVLLISWPLRKITNKLELYYKKSCMPINWK